MAWIKLDDQWMDNPKIIKAGRDARDMWLASVTYCAKQLTDGYFHQNLIPMLAVMAGIDVANCQTFAKTLLDVCLWESKDGMYYVHDYLDYNPTKEQTEQNRIARSEAGRAGGIAKASKMPSKMLANTLAKGVAKSWQKSAPSPSPSPSPFPFPNQTESGDEFSKTQHIIESIIGLPPSGQAGIKAINEIVSMGAIEDDIKAAFTWYQENSEKPIKYYSSLVGPIKTAVAKRTQKPKELAGTNPYEGAKRYD
ncbi:MAG: hypothetical protein WCY09_09905 [Candidatus Omnitrophota bacterium]